MKNIKPLILLMLFGMLSFAQTASGQLQADDTRESTRLAISPYAQAVPNDSYTFIGVSHLILFKNFDQRLQQHHLLFKVFV